MPGPYRAHHYIGEYADDAAATAEIVLRGWDVAGAPRPGMLYYNTTSNELRVWTGGAWTALGGGGVTPGAHLGIGGGVGGTQFNFEDHDTFDTSLCWAFEFLNSALYLPWGAAWYYTLVPSGAESFYAYRVTGDLLPSVGVAEYIDFAIWRHVKINIPALVLQDFVEQHFMVKGFHHDRGAFHNALVGFAASALGLSYPAGGVYSQIDRGAPKAGAYFARSETFANPQNWYACVCEGVNLYSVDTGVSGDNVRLKFHVRVDTNNAWFYINNVEVAHITETQAGVSWPELIDLWPTIGITTLPGGAVQYCLVKLPLIHASQSAPIPPP
jgi:hypothetical protein